MNRIGIVTLNGEHNYGNRLQNYALQQALLRLGISSETIIFKSRKAPLFRLVKTLAVHIVPLEYQRLNYWRMLEKKQSIFRPFSDKYIKSHFINPAMKKRLLAGYDIFITGSDQVWNPAYIKGDSSYFLSFAPKNKRVSYAASFGVLDIPTDQYEFYKNHLSNMHSISVREKAGADIVKKITGLKAELVPDPTMLLDYEAWGKLTISYEYLADEEYVVVYSLHSLDETSWKQIRSYVQKNNLKVYQIMGDFYHKDYKIPDPAEFVARIKYAHAVYTDSFHACVFSIIMNTPFKVFERKDMEMSSRLETLLTTYGMEVAMDSSSLDATAYNFELSDRIATKERARGMRYLSQIILEEKAE